MTVVRAAPVRTVRRYDVVVAAAVAGACLYGLADAVLRPAAIRAVGVLGGPGLAAAVALALAGAVLHVCSRAGPLWITAPEQLWRRSGDVLRVRARAVRSVLLLVAVVIVLVVAASAPGSPLVRVAAGAGAGATVLLAGAAASDAQRRDRARLAGAVGLLAGVTAVSIAAAGSVGSVALAWTALTAAMALIVRVSAGGAHPAQARRRAHPPLWELRRAGAVVDALRMAAVMLDATAVSALADAQRAPRRRPLSAPGWLLLLVRAATTSRVVDLLPLVALPAVAGAVGSAHAATAALLVTTYALGAATSRMLDTWADSSALRRVFAARRPSVGALLAGTGMLMTGAAALIATLLAELPVVWAATAVLVAALGWMRRLSGRRMGARVGALVSTPMGAIPLDLAQRVAAGPDVLVAGLLVLPLLAPAPALVTAGVAAVVYAGVMTARGR